MVTKVIKIKRKQKSWSEDSPDMNIRLINEFVSNNPNAKIITMVDSGVNWLVIVYEID